MNHDIYYVTFECEWDIGINNQFFATEEIARKHVRAALADCGIEEPMEEIEDEGLLSFKLNKLEIINE